MSTPQIYDDTGPPPPTHPPPPAPDSLGGGAFPPPQIDRRLKPARDTSGRYFRYYLDFCRWLKHGKKVEIDLKMAVTAAN